MTRIQEVYAEIDRRRQRQRAIDLAYFETETEADWPKLHLTNCPHDQRYVDYVRRLEARNGVPLKPLPELVKQLVGMGIREPRSDDE